MFALASLLVGSALIGCRRTEFRVPADHGRSVCTVKLAATQDSVRSACGPPCGRGDVPKGHCRPPSGVSDDLSFCSNDCDVYGNVAVCYASGQVVSVRELSAPGERLLRTCTWSVSEASPAPASSGASR